MGQWGPYGAEASLWGAVLSVGHNVVPMGQWGPYGAEMSL